MKRVCVGPGQVVIGTKNCETMCTILLAAVLLVPYLAWVTIAGYLNLAILRLNPP